MEKKFVYVVLLDYSTDDYSGIDLYIFDTYQKALNKFNEIIEQEKQPEMSWVGEKFKNNTFDYELDTNIEDAKEGVELWWNVTDRNDWYFHDFLDLRIKEIK